MSVEAFLPGLAAGASLALVRLPILEAHGHPIVMVTFINIALD